MSKKRKPVDRRMISVPPALNDRMAKLTDENWSAIACRAFERRLGEIAAQKEEKDMDDVIARMKALKDDNQDEAYLLGKEHGESWAKDDATPAQLRRLARHQQSLINEPSYDWQWYFDSTGSSSNWISTCDHLGCTILGVDPKEDRDPAEAFWESAVGEYRNNDNLNDGEYLRGFAEGALEVWEAIEDRL